MSEVRLADRLRSPNLSLVDSSFNTDVDLAGMNGPFKAAVAVMVDATALERLVVAFWPKYFGASA